MHRLPDFRLPDVRVPSLPRLDLDDPGRFTEPLQFFFCLLMFVALVAVFAGATATGVVMLVVGAALHVVRSSLEELAAQRQARRERADRKRQVRLRSHRVARRAQDAGAQPAARPVAKPAASAEVRVAATPRLSPRRRPAVAQPGASPARKQRVI
jgi:hypothetical protein